MLRGHRLSDAAATKLVELMGLGDVNPLDEAIQAQFPGAQVVERKPGAPIRFIQQPETNPTTQDQVWKSIPTDAGKILRDVEIAIGVSLDGAKHIDNTPRPAHYVMAFERVGRDALALSCVLADWTEFFRDQVKLKGGDIQVIEAALAALVDVSSAVIREFKERSSKGARKNTALCETIKRLRYLFRRHYQGPRRGRSQRGAIQHLAEQESRELQFVETALLDSRVIRKNNRDEVRRLFRDPRCAMPNERGAVMKRIANNADGSINRTRQDKLNPYESPPSAAGFGSSRRKKRNK